LLEIYVIDSDICGVGLVGMNVFKWGVPGSAPNEYTQIQGQPPIQNLPNCLWVLEGVESLLEGVEPFHLIHKI